MDAEKGRAGGLERRLRYKERLLEVLELQAAKYTSLAIPPHLQVELDETRDAVKSLQQDLEGAAPPDAASTLSEWGLPVVSESSASSLESTLADLAAYFPGPLLEAIKAQIVFAPAFRRSDRWSITLEPSGSQGKDAIVATLVHSYEQVRNPVAKGWSQQNVVFHIPPWLSNKGRLTAVAVSSAAGLMNIGENDLMRFREDGPNGAFYRIPVQVEEWDAIVVRVQAVVFHPKRSEDLFVSYYPSEDLITDVLIPADVSSRFVLRPEYFHPSRPLERMADVVTTEGSFQRNTYRLPAPVFPYQGIRIAWTYK